MPQEPVWPQADPERTDFMEPVTEIIPAIPAVTTAAPERPQAPGSRRPSRKAVKRAGIIAGSVLGVFVALYAVDLLISQGNVPRGVTVAGVDVGGLKRADAEERLRAQLEPRLIKPVAVRAGDTQSTIDPVRAGLSLDWASTLDQAGTQPINPVTRVTSFFTSREVGVVTRADKPQLVNTLQNLRPQVDRDPVEGSIRFDGAKPTPVEPRDGQNLKVDDAAIAVIEQWASGRPVPLPVDRTPVKVTAQAVRTALTALAQPAVAGPLVIHGEGVDATLQPAQIAPALRFEPADGGTLVLKIDNAKIADAATPQLKSSERQGKDAAIVFDGGSPHVEPSVDGKGVDWDPTLQPLPDVLKTTGKREIVAKYLNTPAKVTTDQANGLGITQVIGEFTTGGFAPDSGVNIRTVAQKVNGAIVKPGETFSLNGFTGPRGPAQGYVEAGVIENGAPGREVGGGISQFATTLYNASYFAGMKDAGHREHSYYISRYPAAREATVFQNPDGSSVIDLKFTNDSDTGVAIQTIWSPSSITVKLWGTKRYNVESVPGPRVDPVDPQPQPGAPENCHASNGAPGFTTSDTRVLRDAKSGQEVRRDTRTVHYNPQPKITCP